MFRIALLFALASTSAIACEDTYLNFDCSISQSKERMRQDARDLDAQLQAQREYDQRERLSFDDDRRQQLIQGQLNQLNMNTVPLR